MTGAGVQILANLLEGTLLWAIGLAFFHPLPRKSGYFGRTAAMLLAAIALTWGAGQSVWSMRDVALMSGAGLIYQVLCGLFCCQVKPSVAFYCSIWAMMCHILIYELCCLAGYSFSFLPEQGVGMAILMRTLITGSVFLAVGITVELWLPVYRQNHAGPRQSVSAFMLYIIFVSLIFAFYRNGKVDFSGMLDLVLLMVQLYCLIVLYLQAALFQNSAIRRERDAIEQLWLQQKAHYEQSKESIAIINQKTHDLKHQLSAMRTMDSSTQREQYIQEIEESVQIYDSMLKTGNETLDTVLTEKSLFCKAHSISLTCVADGAKLGFMDPVDIYTMMGNAMDNAIEAVEEFEQTELRTIDVVIYARQSLLVISVTNPLREELVLEDGLPHSTKPKDGYHGFGVRSMRTTARKYGGELTVDTRDGCFGLNIVFPLEN